MATKSEIQIIVRGDSKDAQKAFKSVTNSVNDLDKVSKKVSSDINNSFSGVSKVAYNIMSAFSNVKNSAQTLGNQISSSFAGAFKELGSGISSTIKDFFKFATVIKASQIVMSGVTNLFKAGFNAVNEYKLSLVSLAATMTTFNKESKPDDIAKEYVKFRKRAEEIVPVIDNLAAKTLLSGDAVKTVVSEFAKGGQIIDSSNKKQIAALTNISNALGVILGDQANQAQITQEIGDLWQGQVTSSSSLGQVLKGVIGPNVKEQLTLWKEQGILIEKVGENLKAFGVASEDLKDSWAAVSSTIQTTVNNILRSEFGTITDSVVQQTQEWNSFLQKNPQIISEIVDNLEVVVRTIGVISSSTIKVNDLWKSFLKNTEDTTGINNLQEKVDKLNQSLILIPTPFKIVKRLFEEFDKLQNVELQDARVGVSFNTQEIDKAVEGVKNISSWTERVTENIKVSNGELLKFNNTETKTLETTKTVVESLNDQINSLLTIDSSQKKILDNASNLTKEEKAKSKAIGDVIDKYTKLNTEADRTNSGLNKHQLAIKDIQNELEAVTKSYGAIPQFIDQATSALQREISAANTLKSKLKEAANLSAQRSIAESSSATVQERVDATKQVRDAELDAINTTLNERLKAGADELTAYREYEVKAEDIKKQFADKINEIEKSKWDFLDKMRDESTQKTKEAFEETSNSIKSVADSMGDAADSAFRFGKAIAIAKKEAKETSEKAKKFGSILATDTVSSLALQRNLRLAGIGVMPNRNISSFGNAAFGIQSVVSESQQQQSRRMAITDILGKAATGVETGFTEEQLQGLRTELKEKFGQNFGGGAVGNQVNDNSVNINNSYNISTPDAQSFRSSHKQLMEEADRMAQQVARRGRRSVSAGSRA